jgi:DNA-3-methyladenine glycosylase I
VQRCAWAGEDPLMVAYHDEEWGVPSHDPRHLFEMLTLEGAQAGLSWRTILNKRAAYRRAFARFDPKKVARFGAADVKRLMNDEGIVRNRLKIAATIGNARAFLEVPDFDEFVWSFVGGKPRINRPRTLADLPAHTAESDALSKALLARGFRFVGSTIMYSFMQACGLVNDHARTCFKAAR